MKQLYDAKTPRDLLAATDEAILNQISPKVKVRPSDQILYADYRKCLNDKIKTLSDAGMDDIFQEPIEKNEAPSTSAVQPRQLLPHDVCIQNWRDKCSKLGGVLTDEDLRVAVKYYNHNGDTPFHTLIRNRDPLLTELLDKSPVGSVKYFITTFTQKYTETIGQTYYESVSPLELAVQLGERADAILTIAKKAKQQIHPCSFAPGKQVSILHVIARYIPRDDTTDYSEIIKFSKDLTTKDGSGRTPLFYLAECHSQPRTYGSQLINYTDNPLLLPLIRETNSKGDTILSHCLTENGDLSNIALNLFNRVYKFNPRSAMGELCSALQRSTNVELNRHYEAFSKSVEQTCNKGQECPSKGKNVQQLIAFLLEKLDLQPNQALTGASVESVRHTFFSASHQDSQAADQAVTEIFDQLEELVAMDYHDLSKIVEEDAKLVDQLSDVCRRQGKEANLETRWESMSTDDRLNLLKQTDIIIASRLRCSSTNTP